eukprot:2180878-Prorocentrum_lima.AAC.1
MQARQLLLSAPMSNSTELRNSLAALQAWMHNNLPYVELDRRQDTITPALQSLLEQRQTALDDQKPDDFKDLTKAIRKQRRIDRQADLRRTFRHELDIRD